MRDGSSRSRHPLPRSTVDALPPVLAEDVGAATLARAVDTMLAPAIEALDDLDAYLDPRLAPDDWIDWLLSWLGLPVSDRMSTEVARELLKSTDRIGAHIGTARGLREFLTVVTRGLVLVTDNGGVRWVDGETIRNDRPTVEISVVGADVDRRIAGELAAELVPLGTDWSVV